MFRDDDGRLCAVANLIHADGRDDLVDDVAAHDNDLQIADVHDGPLYDWVLDSGLTQEELARIQLPIRRIRGRAMPLADASWRPSAARKEAPAAAAAPTEAEVRAELQTRLAQVEAELRATTEGSLDVATMRFFTLPGGGADSVVLAAEPPHLTY
jgi:hypothetical protein